VTKKVWGRFFPKNRISSIGS